MSGKEFFVEIDSDDYFLGRIIVTPISGLYTAEIDIVNRETKKIYRHVAQLFKEHSEQEALDLSVQKLSAYLGQLKNEIHRKID